MKSLTLPSSFAPKTQELLARANIATAASIYQLDASTLRESGINFVVLDYDGVIAPYNEPMTPQSKEHLAEFAEVFPLGVAVASNNRHLNPGILPTGIELFTPRCMRDLKPLGGVVRHALRSAGASPKESLGVGDGMSDIIAFRLLGMHALLVDSIGPHPIQDQIHQRIYGPCLRGINRLHLI